MNSNLPARARAVVVGGGVAGCSVAYHLAKRGWDDVILLEQDTLTSGTTWHAAGLVTQQRPTVGLMRLVQHSLALFTGLEAETGQPTGFRQSGTLNIAATPQRWEEMRRQASIARSVGIEADFCSPAECVDRFPLLDPRGVVGGVFYPRDGRGNPVDMTQSLARGARMHGSQVLEKTRATGFRVDSGRVSAVLTEQGEIQADVVVNTTGMWAREVGAMTGVRLPLQALVHSYAVTDSIPGLSPDLPVLKSPDDWSYVKEDSGKLLVGFFEPGSKPWASGGIPEGAAFTRLPENWDHIGPFYEKIAERLPLLGGVGIQLLFSGPESFTPDGFFHFGAVAGIEGYYTACGFNSIGFLTGPGAGKVLADWIVDGYPAFDLAEVDPRRVMGHQVNRRYLEARVVETLDLAYDLHWPYQQHTSARGIRRSPLHDRVAAAGACFGEVGGWERANWYAPDGVAPKYSYAFGQTAWFGHWAGEHQAVRENVGIFDLSSFGKILVQGRHAETVLQRVCANDVAVEPDRTVYTQWCNERGGIEADVTVTRLAEREFLVLTSTACLPRDLAWLRRHIGGDEDATAADVTNVWAMVPVMGPRSRELLQSLTDADLSNPAFPFGTSREIDLGFGFVRANRLTYVGELGWELLIPADMAVHCYETVVAAGAEHGLRHAGYHALESLRLEKAYRSYGHDLGVCDTPLEAGLSFAVAFDKPGGFIGREALLAQRRRGLRRRLVQLSLDNPEVFAYHDEPIWRDGVRVGRITSAGYGHTLGRTVALGYVTAEEPITAEWVKAGAYEVEVAAERHTAACSVRPMYDPESRRVRLLPGAAPGPLLRRRPERDPRPGPACYRSKPSRTRRRPRPTSRASARRRVGLLLLERNLPMYQLESIPCLLRMAFATTYMSIATTYRILMNRKEPASFTK